jgi:hypothetical protein
MAKESRPKGASDKGVQATPGTPPPPDRGSAGSRSDNRGFYVNERGQQCYGDKCLNLTVDEERREVVVNVKPDATCDVSDFVEAVKRTLTKGARTVYEVESEYKEDKPK